MQKPVTIRQIKAARALLDWTSADLASASTVAESTIWRLESADGPIGGRPETAEKLIAALERAGVEFIDDVGVKLKGQLFSNCKIQF
jgi:transcriptional regulator with XRE-family HTH domain